MRITVFLDAPDGESLLRLARQERRRPADQAAVLIEKALNAESQVPPDKEVADVAGR